MRKVGTERSKCTTTPNIPVKPTRITILSHYGDDATEISHSQYKYSVTWIRRRDNWTFKKNCSKVFFGKHNDDTKIVYAHSDTSFICARLWNFRLGSDDCTLERKRLGYVLPQENAKWSGVRTDINHWAYVGHDNRCTLSAQPLSAWTDTMNLM